MQYTTEGNAVLILDDASAIPATETEHPYVLVVDDDNAILSVVMYLLENEGYTGIGFTESEQVLPFLQEMRQRGRQHLPALILLDLMMPHISGYDIAHWLADHESYAHIPILVMTADMRVRDKNGVPGAADFLFKPFQISTLISKLEHYLYPLDAHS
ncbi:MAG TPA: response regulator [Ktedonobacteraceae bacterium]|nr:response regulator [Ktedonobacteraceae bacterium]